jgi:MFS family permease
MMEPASALPLSLRAVPLLPDIGPLRRHRDFRLLYIGQFVSLFGSMLSYVALPFALYQATRSPKLLGLLGVIQLVPSVIGGLFGGALADAVDRRRLILLCEAGMALCTGALGLLALRGPLPAPLLLWAAALLAVCNGFHRPALEALTPLLVRREDMASLGVLGSFRYNVGAIAGPSLAGMILSWGGTARGPALAFLIDAGTFLIAMAAVAAIRFIPPSAPGSRFSLPAVREGFRYALSRQELIGTYVVDMVAMTFSMPNLLFPAVAEEFAGHPDRSAAYLGWLHAGIPLGALFASLTSGWARSVRRHGLLILWAAGSWSAFMIGFGWARSFPVAMAFLILAGYADMVSGVFRSTIWNETIPSELRGRLAGIEMISYLSGPMLGNTQLGLLADHYGVRRAIRMSSLIGLLGVAGCAVLLPRFRRYLAERAPAGSPPSPAAPSSPASDGSPPAPP